MFFRKLREQMKVVIIIVVVAMAGGLLWAGGASLFGGRGQDKQAVQAVIATVNGQGITYYDFHQAFINRLQQIEQQQGVLPGKSYEAVKFQALDALVGSVLLTQEIANRKIAASKEEIDEELQLIIEQFSSEEDYKLQLEMAGLTEEALKKHLAEDIKFNKLKDEIIGGIPVSEEEIKEAYERVRASHILITAEEETEEGWLAAETKALEVFDQLSGDNFAELAELYSQDGSSSQGGDIGFIFRGQTVPEFEEAAFALEVGEVSSPVRSAFGFHIITVTEKEEAQGEEFNKVRPRIERSLREEKGREDLSAWFEGLKEEAQIIYTDYQMLAFQEVLAGNLEDAVHYYNLAIEEEPNDGYLYASLGDVYQEMGQGEEAVSQYELAVEKFPHDHTLYAALADLYAENEKIDEAAGAYLKASELVPNDLYALLDLYTSLNGLERYEEARVVETLIEEFQERQRELTQEKSDDGEGGQEPSEPQEEAAPEE